MVWESVLRQPWGKCGSSRLQKTWSPILGGQASSRYLERGVRASQTGRRCHRCQSGRRCPKKTRSLPNGLAQIHPSSRTRPSRPTGSLKNTGKSLLSQYGRSKRPFSTFWQRFRSASRQKRVLRRQARGLLLLLPIGATVLAVALRSHVPVAGLDPPGGSAQGTVLASTTAHSTPSITTTPTTNTPSPPLTLVFTCRVEQLAEPGRCVCIPCQMPPLLSRCDIATATWPRGRASMGLPTRTTTVTSRGAGTSPPVVSARPQRRWLPDRRETVTQSVTFTVSR